ncbi:MAG: DUF6351 family protein [Burkholderiaceae bacterium]|nr:DUF6351 family protein [Burkholderiaceae bacterium]
MSLSITSLSSRPDIVTGGDALLQVSLPTGKDPTKITVQLNGQDVTGKFRVQPDGTTLLGLLDKSEARYTLRNGANTVEAFYDGVASGSLALTNYPSSGPVFSGPRESPFVCETAQFVLPDGSTLGPPLNYDSCAASTRTHYVYWSSSKRRFLPTATPGQLPADAATITVEGRQVRFVVRIETGTVNRAIYQLAMLHDPSADPAPSVFARSAGWNGKLVYSFGGGCSQGWYRQGTKIGWASWFYDDAGVLQREESVLDQELLGRGYAVASSTLNVFGQNCNEVTAAETMAMVKERFIEAFGVPRFTIGWGCSGGAYQQHHIADNYPGLLDGLVIGCSYPEVSFTTVHYVGDARLLNRYFNGQYYAVPSYSDAQKQAISGLLGLATLQRMDNETADRIGAADCPSVLPWELRYDLNSNPGGARCGVFDHTVNVWGTRPNPLKPAYTIAMRPLDNVGIQYGLKALNDGVITVDEFLDLNEKVGGFDSDGRPTAATGVLPAPRSVADSAALATAYTSGRMLYGGWGLKDVPIIDYRLYEDRVANGTYHQRYNSFIARERLKKANGSAANQVMLLEGNASWPFSSESPLVLHALEQMDLWLSNVVADTSADPLSTKVVRNKPSTLREGCVPPGSQFPNFVAETLTMDSGYCANASRFPAGIGTRAVAGGPTVADIAKCQLKSVATALSDGTYAATFSTSQRTRLANVFPSGVCDWTRRGVGQPSAAEYRSLQPWQRFD